jgi:hypothetical protein
MLRRVPLHPWLFAAYPVLFLAATNLQGQVSLGDAMGPLLASVAGATFALVALWAAFRSARKAALVVSACLVAFFSYGHVTGALEGAGLPEPVLLALWMLPAVGVAVAVTRARGDLERPTLVLNVLAAVLVSMNLVPIAADLLDRSDPSPGVTATELGLPSDPELAPGGKRDIYYLIFDRYAGLETLQERYGLDNDGFLDRLEARGFYVARESAANHPRTGHSLASSLNMTLLDDLEAQEGASNPDWGAIHRLLKDAELTRYLRSLGYRYHHIGSWWEPTAESPFADVNHSYDAPSEFSTVLLRSTMWPAIENALGLEEELGHRATERRRVAYQIESLLSVEDDPAPTFTLAHFLIPHPPFVFDRDGGPVTDEMVAERGTQRNYVEQLVYTNSVIEEMVAELLETDGEEPIIVVQSDEGPHPPRLSRQERSFKWFEATDTELRDKLFILNAYHLPDGHDDGLYPTISPVNSFRLILNEYFGAGLELLDDDIYIYRDFHHPYDFRPLDAERIRG